jgi:endonuclease YncB( thermonuclease family)
MSICATLSLCAVLQGTPYVVDGDTLRFGKQSVRLFGIDAEERNEPNGPRATEGLRRIVAATAYIKCQPTGDTTYNRVVATCHTAEGWDVAQLLVYQGLVLDCARYSGGRYRSYEPSTARATLAQKPYCWRKS